MTDIYIEIDYKPSPYTYQDPAALDIVQGCVNSSQFNLSMFHKRSYVVWAAEKYAASECFPLKNYKFKANRKAFRYRPGDLVALTFPNSHIYEKVVRISTVEEEDLETEEITVTAVEAVEYLAAVMPVHTYWQNAGHGEGPVGEAEDPDKSINRLDHIAVWEAPYDLVGSKIAVIVAAGREVLREIGFSIHLSPDNATYALADTARNYAVHGELVNPYPATFAIDDQVGMIVDFDNTDVRLFESVTRTALRSGWNLCSIGGEIVRIQTITPVSPGRYKLSGIVRALYDTERQEHAAGTDFWYLGGTLAEILEDDLFVVNAERFVKCVPFSASRVGDISEALMRDITIEGRALKPLRPAGFQCNGGGNLGTYSADCVLSWRPRVRGQGAGSQIETFQPDPTHEGAFEIEVWVAGVLRRTVTGLDAYTWTYSSAVNSADNGGVLPDEIVFKLRNYIQAGQLKHNSAWSEIVVRRV